VGAVIAVVVVWFLLGLIFTPAQIALEHTLGFIFGAAGSIFIGAWQGLHLGFAAAKALVTFTLLHPSIGSAIAGIIAGMVVTSLDVAFRVKEKKSGPVASAIFSPEVWESRNFLVMMAVNALLGYLTTEALSAMGLITTAASSTGPSLQTVVSLVMGAGAGGPGGGNPIGSIFAFLIVLAALIVIGLIAAAVAGGAIGFICGPGPWTFSIDPAIHGAASGATVSLLKGERGGEKRQSVVKRVFLGTFVGAVDGMLVGAAVGATFALGHLFG